MKTWVKLTAAIAVGAAIWGGIAFDDYYSEKEQASKKQEVKLVDFETKDVLKLTVQNKAGKFVFQRENSTANWKMTEPTGPRPDQDTVNNLLSAVQSTNYEQNIEDAQKVADAIKSGNLAAGKDYGFEPPRSQIEIEVAANKDAGTKARNLKIWLGGDLNIGGGAGAAFNALSVYAVTSERKGLLVVGSSFVTSLSKELKDFRSKIVGDYSVTDVKEFELTRNDGSVVALAKSQENGQSKWSVTKPKAVKADNNQVGLYLDSWTRLRSEKITEAASVNDQNKAALGLVQPNATLVLKGEGGKVLQKIDIGLTNDALYATMSDGAVGSFELSKFPDLAPPLKYFRDRRVFSGFSFNDVSKLKTVSGKVYQKEERNWYLIGAVPTADAKKPEKVAIEDARKFVEDWEFATAEDVLDADATTNLATFGLDKPITRFTLSATDEKKMNSEILVGNRVPNNEKSVYVKRADTPDVFVMETKWLDVLTRLDQGGQSPQAKK
ncbi:MAG: hypothetical protein RI953_66 [Pseudomonadota bacterium]|jgi:hypothetical protein